MKRLPRKRNKPTIIAGLGIALLVLVLIVLNTYYRSSSISTHEYSVKGYDYVVNQQPANPISGENIVVDILVKQNGSAVAGVPMDISILPEKASPSLISVGYDREMYEQKATSQDGKIELNYTAHYRSVIANQHILRVSPVSLVDVPNGVEAGLAHDLHIAPHWLSWFVF